MIYLIASAILQCLVFTLPGFLFYLIKNRSLRGFLPWVGLTWKHPDFTRRENVLYSLIILGVMGTKILSVMFIEKQGSQLQTSFQGMAPSVAIVSIFITAFINNGFSEEILFRSYIGRGIIHLLGYKTGNIVQSLIFTSIHLFVIVALGPAIGILTASMVFAMGYLMGRIMLRNCRNSIIWPILIHGGVNFIMYCLDYFVL